MRTIAWVLAGLMSLPAVAVAQESRGVRTQRVRRVPRDRFRGTWSFGATVGLGSPLGIAGTFVELRPLRALGVNVGAGLGGTFGPSVSTGLFFSPLGTRGFSLNIGASWSHHFSLLSGEVVPGRPALPASTNWVNVEVAGEFRPSRGVMLRVGVGHAWLIDTRDFRIGTTSEVDNVRSQLPFSFGSTPADAVYAAASGETLGVWFVHLDVAPSWRF